MSVALIFLAFVSTSASINIASAASCGPYMQRVQSFHDGYRGKLKLPVLQTVRGWKVEIEFDKHIRTFDTPSGNLEGGRKAGLIFNILNHRHNSDLIARKNLVIDFTVHYQRSMIPPPKIKKISFGQFSCMAEDIGTEEGECIFAQDLPDCGSALRKINTWPDGFRARLALPVERSVHHWKLLLVFNKPIKVLDFPQGDIEKKVNRTEFMIKSKDYNGKLKQGSTITFDLTVHYQRGQAWTNLVAVIFDPVQYVCANQLYREILQHRYDGVADTKNALIGANWIGSCEKPIAECRTMFELQDSWPDGFRGYLKIPIKRDVQGWNVTVFFDEKIRNFDVNQGHKIVSHDDVYFVVRNHGYNNRLKGGSVFSFEITVHFSRHSKPRPEVSWVRFNNKDLCENKDKC